MSGRLHYAWIVAAITFVIVVLTAGVRAAPGVLIVPLEHEFQWSRATISFAVGVNVLLYGAIGPFAAALIDRFGMRRTMTLSLTATATRRGADAGDVRAVAARAAVGRCRRHRLRLYRRLSRAADRGALVQGAARAGDRRADCRQRSRAAGFPADNGRARDLCRLARDVADPRASASWCLCRSSPG